MKKNLFTKAAAFIAVAALTAGTFAGCSNSGSKDNATTVAGATKAEQTTDKQDNNAAADFDTSKDITVVTREEGSGTRGAFVELTGVEQKNSDGKKIDMTTEEAIVQSSTQNVITAVNGDTYAIGYVSLGSLNKDVIVTEMGYAADLHREALIATGVVLFVFILIINLLLAFIKRRKD